MGGPEDTHANKLILGGPEDTQTRLFEMILQGVRGTHNPDLFICCEGVRRTLTSRLTICIRVGGPEDTRVNRKDMRGGPGDTHFPSCRADVGGPEDAQAHQLTNLQSNFDTQLSVKGSHNL